MLRNGGHGVNRVPIIAGTDLHDAARMSASRVRNASVLPKRRIRRSTVGELCWKDMSKYGATPSVLVSACTSVGRISAGWR